VEYKKTSITKITRTSGKVYKSVEEMPPDVRKEYERTMASLKHEEKPRPDASTSTSEDSLADMGEEPIIFDGKAYSYAGEMPPDVRQAYLRARKCLDESPDNPAETITTEIVIDGRKYSGVEEMPPGVRREYEKMMDLEGPLWTKEAAAGNAQIICNDKEYSSIEEMPPEVRRAYLEVMSSLGGSTEHPLSTDLSIGQKHAPGEKFPESVHVHERTLTTVEFPAESDEDADSSSKMRLIATLVIVVVLMALLAWINR
jgi:hypothetical protein